MSAKRRRVGSCYNRTAHVASGTASFSFRASASVCRAPSPCVKGNTPMSAARTQLARAREQHVRVTNKSPRIMKASQNRRVDGYGCSNSVLRTARHTDPREYRRRGEEPGATRQRDAAGNWLQSDAEHANNLRARKEQRPRARRGEETDAVHSALHFLALLRRN